MKSLIKTPPDFLLFHLLLTCTTEIYSQISAVRAELIGLKLILLSSKWKWKSQGCPFQNCSMSTTSHWYLQKRTTIRHWMPCFIINPSHFINFYAELSITSINKVTAGKQGSSLCQRSYKVSSQEAKNFIRQMLK